MRDGIRGVDNSPPSAPRYGQEGATGAARTEAQRRTSAFSIGGLWARDPFQKPQVRHGCPSPRRYPGAGRVMSYACSKDQGRDQSKSVSPEHALSSL